MFPGLGITLVLKQYALSLTPRSGWWLPFEMQREAMNLSFLEAMRRRNKGIPSSRTSSFLILILRPKIKPHDLIVGDRVDIRMRVKEEHVVRFMWYRGTVISVQEVNGFKSSAMIKYDDGDFYQDYFDGRPGSLVYKKLSAAALNRLEGIAA